MRFSNLLFLATVGVSAAMAIIAAAREDRSGTYLFKPLTTVIVLLGAAFLVRPAAEPYRGLVVLGLALSLAGDVLLLPPRERFAAGLAAFLLAHVAYIAAFSTGSPPTATQLAGLLPFAAVCAAVVWYVWKGLGALRVAVPAYAATIAVMAWRAAARGQAPGVTRASFVLAFGGACLFVLSDAILAVRRFRHPSRAAHAVELGVYWAAQTMIALSIRA